MQVVGQPHHPLAQPEIAMERRQMAVHAVDQPRIHRHRDVRAVQRRLEVRRILPRPRVEQRLLHVRVHRHAERAAERAEGVEEGRHRRLPIGAIRRRAQLAVSGLIDLDRLAVGERDRGIREVGVREDRVDVVRRSGERRGVGQDLLLGIGQRVRRPADDVPQVERVRRQPRLRRDRLLDRRRSRSSGPRARCTRPRRRSSRRSAASPAACPGQCETRVSSSDSMLA